MDQSRDTLKKAYKSVILYAVFREKDFRTKCLEFLEKCEVKSCFKFLPLKDIQREFCGKATGTEDAKYHHLCKVFQQFEKYAARLVAKPWCKDLYTIKVYTGFFKYNFERWISTDTVYRVFELIGYKTASADTLSLEPPPNEDRALALGLELYLAHTQLYRLKTTGFLTSDYLMEDVMEGWMNTTGNTVDILDWLAKNKYRANELSQFQELDLSRMDIPDQTTRPKSVTIDEKPLYFDKNGHYVGNQVRYPPNDNTGDDYNKALRFQDKIQSSRNRHDESSDNVNNFSSLVFTNYSDFELYGNSENSTSTAPASIVPSNDLEATAPLSLPFKSSNGNYKNHCDEYGDYVELSASILPGNHIRYQCEHNPQDETRTKNWLSPNTVKNVVARGGNLELFSATLDSSSIDKNIVSREGKKRVEKIMADRIKLGEKRVAGKHSQDGLISNGGEMATLGCGKCGDVVCMDCVGTHTKQHAVHASTECEREDDNQEFFV